MVHQAGHENGRGGFRLRSLSDRFGANGAGGSRGRATRDRDELVATGLGWFSIGLGLVQLVAPRALSQMIGLRGDGRDVTLQRVVGVREIMAGVGILGRPRPAEWVWSRVAGDTMDLALLGAAFTSKKTDKGRLSAATSAVLGIFLLDLYDALQLTRKKRGGGDGDMRVVKAITVNSPPEAVYGFWRNFENFPRFMDHVESVQANGNGRSHWKAKGPAGKSVEWDAEIVEDRPNELIAWRSVPGSEVENAGSVRFVSAPGGRGTEVHVEMEYDPPAGLIGAAIAKLFGQEPSGQMTTDLRQFKQMVEVGEVVHSDASIAGEPHAAQPPETVPPR